MNTPLTRQLFAEMLRCTWIRCVAFGGARIASEAPAGIGAVLVHAKPPVVFLVVHYSARQQYVGRRASCRLMLNGEVIASTEADTEELAVALSALKSVGVDVEALHG